MNHDMMSPFSEESALQAEKESGIAGAILAGGKNIRMGGKEKGLIHVQGTALIERTINLLKGIFEEIILVSNSEENFKDYSSKIIITSDIITGIGPLGGVYTGLCRTSREAVFFVACDMPFLETWPIREEIRRFKELKCEAMVPRIGELIEPLHAVYKKSLKDKISALIKGESNYSIRSLFKTINVHYLDLEDNQDNRNIFVNLNTPKDFKEVGRASGVSEDRPTE